MEHGINGLLHTSVITITCKICTCRYGGRQCMAPQWGWDEQQKLSKKSSMLLPWRATAFYVCGCLLDPTYACAMRLGAHTGHKTVYYVWTSHEICRQRSHHIRIGRYTCGSCGVSCAPCFHHVFTLLHFPVTVCVPFSLHVSSMWWEVANVGHSFLVLYFFCGG
jgi:hypothetical protein